MVTKFNPWVNIVDSTEVYGKNGNFPRHQRNKKLRKRQQKKWFDFQIRFKRIQCCAVRCAVWDWLTTRAMQKWSNFMLNTNIVAIRWPLNGINDNRKGREKKEDRRQRKTKLEWKSHTNRNWSNRCIEHIHRRTATELLEVQFVQRQIYKNRATSNAIQIHTSKQIKRRGNYFHFYSSAIYLDERIAHKTTAPFEYAFSVLCPLQVHKQTN